MSRYTVLKTADDNFKSEAWKRIVPWKVHSSALCLDTQKMTYLGHCRDDDNLKEDNLILTLPIHCKDLMLLDIYFQIKENKNILPQIHKHNYYIVRLGCILLIISFFKKIDNLVYETLWKNKKLILNPFWQNHAVMYSVMHAGKHETLL